MLRNQQLMQSSIVCSASSYELSKQVVAGRSRQLRLAHWVQLLLIMALVDFLHIFLFLRCNNSWNIVWNLRAGKLEEELKKGSNEDLALGLVLEHWIVLQHRAHKGQHTNLNPNSHHLL